MFTYEQMNEYQIILFYCLMCIFLRVLKDFDRCQSAHEENGLRVAGTYSEFRSE